MDIPEKRSTSERKKYVKKVMLDGSVVISQLYRKFGDHIKNKLGVKKLPKSVFVNHILDLKKNSKQVRVKGITIPIADVVKLQAIKDVEYDIICSYRKACVKYANIMSQKYYIDFVDLYQEAILAVINGIYTFKKVKNNNGKGYVTLGTHIFINIQGRLKRYANNNCKILGHLTNEAISLVARLNKQLKTYNDYVTMDTVYQDMKLNQKEINILNKASIKVYTALSGEDEDEEGNSGYTYYAIAPKTNYTYLDAKMAMEEAPLSDLEREVFQKYIFEAWTFDQIAEESYNPKTDYPYSKQRIQQVYKCACEKVRKAYFGKELKAA